MGPELAALARRTGPGQPLWSFFSRAVPSAIPQGGAVGGPAGPEPLPGAPRGCECRCSPPDPRHE
eukprot:9182565-Pyramimonas_sp.AAC.1